LDLAILEDFPAGNPAPDPPSVHKDSAGKGEDIAKESDRS
jgi:hypothetical protein